MVVNDPDSISTGEAVPTRVRLMERKPPLGLIQAAPHLVNGDTVKAMRPGAVIVDISIDQGGCFETSHVTTHSAPTYVVDDVVHYCVGNMPGAVPRTSTYALTNVTLPYALEIAGRGLEDAVRADPALALGVNVYRGRVTNAGVATAHGLGATPLGSLIDGLG